MLGIDVPLKPRAIGRISATSTSACGRRGLAPERPPRLILSFPRTLGLSDKVTCPGGLGGPSKVNPVGSALSCAGGSSTVSDTRSNNSAAHYCPKGTYGGTNWHNRYSITLD
jgi:hypothetical protein